jgi:hypothetical protein
MEAPLALLEHPEQLDYTFTAPIQIDGAFAFFLTVPGSADLLGTRKAAKVEGTIEGHPFAATLMPSGTGPHWLPLKVALRRQLPASSAGDVVSVHLTKRLS